jgi:hypothetical protein
MNNHAIGRRTFLSAAGAAALTAAGALDPPRSCAQQPVPNTTGTELAKLKAPANAADCHIHIYNPRFQEYNPGRARPKNATVQDYQPNRSVASRAERRGRNDRREKAASNKVRSSSVWTRKIERKERLTRDKG